VKLEDGSNMVVEPEYGDRTASKHLEVNEARTMIAFAESIENPEDHDSIQIILENTIGVED